MQTSSTEPQFPFWCMHTFGHLPVYTMEALSVSQHQKRCCWFFILKSRENIFICPGFNFRRHQELCRAAAVALLKRFRMGLSLHQSKQLNNFTPHSHSQTASRSSNLSTWIFPLLLCNSMLPFFPKMNSREPDPFPSAACTCPRNQELLGGPTTGSGYFRTTRVTTHRQHMEHKNVLSTLELSKNSKLLKGF